VAAQLQMKQRTASWKSLAPALSGLQLVVQPGHERGESPTGVIIIAVMFIVILLFAGYTCLFQQKHEGSQTSRRTPRQQTPRAPLISSSPGPQGSWQSTAALAPKTEANPQMYLSPFSPLSPATTAPHLPQDITIPQDERFIVGVPAMQFPPVEGPLPIEYPVTDPAGNHLFLVTLHTLPGRSKSDDDEPRERVCITSPDQQYDLATCCVHRNPGGACECRIYNGHGESCGVLTEDSGVLGSVGYRTFIFHPDLSRGGSDFGMDLLTIRGNPRKLQYRILQGDREVIADCEPGESPLGPGVRFYQITCRGRADIGLSVLMTLGTDRLVAYKPPSSRLADRAGEGRSKPDECDNM
jgi:hypothetical protein